LQLWAVGGAASVEELKKEVPSFEYVSTGTFSFQERLNRGRTPSAHTH
jgi:hypothetical protein